MEGTLRMLIPVPMKLIAIFRNVSHIYQYLLYDQSLPVICSISLTLRFVFNILWGFIFQYITRGGDIYRNECITSK